jgi:hypothetical protein
MVELRSAKEARFLSTDSPAVNDAKFPRKPTFPPARVGSLPVPLEG